MPTTKAPALTETSVPWLTIWNRMHAELSARARSILRVLNFDEGLNIDSSLNVEEEACIGEIATGLTLAAVESQKISKGVVVASLTRLAAKPELFSLAVTPVAVQWELANHYRRADEEPGRFAMDLWGSEQVAAPYIWGAPTPENISRAAKLAKENLRSSLSPGQPPHPAHEILADRLGEIFRSSGHCIKRRREKQVRHNRLVYIENGPFHEFLRIVLSPLSDFLREGSLRPITIDSIVRLAHEGVG